MVRLTIEERWRWWRETLGSPKYVCAPMVLQSELAFRMQIRKHGVGLCYAPMVPVQAFLDSPVDGEDCEHPLTGGPCTQAAWFTTVPEDRPTFAQIGGSEPSECLAVARILQGSVDAVDVNMGCPQRCAETGGYGAFLLDQPECARKIIETLVDGLDVPVTAKIRIMPALEETIAFARMLEDAGVACLAVHGRLREARQHQGPADWSVIAAVKAALRIPVIANGNVRRKADADRCMEETGVDAVMSATALLHNPRLFASCTSKSSGGCEHSAGSSHADASISGVGSGGGSGGSGCLVRDGRPTALGRRAMASEYLECCRRYPDGALPRMMSDHLLTILAPDLPPKEKDRDGEGCGRHGGRPHGGGTPAGSKDGQSTREEEAWRQAIKKKCKAYRTLVRTPDDFERHVVRALAMGPPAASSAEKRTDKVQEPRLPAAIASGRPTKAAPLDSETIERAVKRGLVARRRARRQHQLFSCDGWRWAMGGSAAGLAAFSAWLAMSST